MVVWGFGREFCDSLFIWPVTEQLYSICVRKTAAFLSASMPPFPKIQDSCKALSTETIPDRLLNISKPVFFFSKVSVKTLLKIFCSFYF